MRSSISKNLKEIRLIIKIISILNLHTKKIEMNKKLNIKLRNIHLLEHSQHNHERKT
jgi:hypothetical protein